MIHAASILLDCSVGFQYQFGTVSCREQPKVPAHHTQFANVLHDIEDSS